MLTASDRRRRCRSRLPRRRRPAPRRGDHRRPATTRAPAPDTTQPPTTTAACGVRHDRRRGALPNAHDRVSTRSTLTAGGADSPGSCVRAERLRRVAAAGRDRLARARVERAAAGDVLRIRERGRGGGIHRRSSDRRRGCGGRAELVAAVPGARGVSATTSPSPAALIDELVANWCADPARVYSTGMSNGGFFTARLICEMADRIAAAVSVAGTYHPEGVSIRRATCRTSRSTAPTTRSVPYRRWRLDADDAPTAPDELRVFFEQVIPEEFDAVRARRRLRRHRRHATSART